MERLAEKYAVDFVFIYGKEAHPSQTRLINNLAERLAQARAFDHEMNAQHTVLVDEFEERSIQQLYHSLDNSAFVLDREGRIVLKLAIADPDRVEEVLRHGLGQLPRDHSHPPDTSAEQEDAENE